MILKTQEKVTINTTTHTTTNTITKNINNNIKVIEETLIFSEYHAEYYRNDSNNKNNYIVVHYDGHDEYIDYLFLNINIFDYLNVFNKNDFSTSYLKEFDMFHYNGFLCIEYNENQIYNEQNINKFFEKYGNYFLENLKNRVSVLHDKVNKEIITRHKLGELFIIN